MIKGIKAEKICDVNKEMIDELETLLECPRNYFTIECINTTYISEGKLVESFPFIEVAWFDRGQEIKDRAAEIITRLINSVGYKNVDIYFRALEKSCYYENGVHF